MTTAIDHWADSVDSGDWDRITEELNEYGGALLPRLLTPEEAARIAGLYEQDEHFRSTVNMGRHRFGEGEYRYFARPFPEPIEQLKQALYPHLLPIARDRDPHPPRSRPGLHHPGPARGVQARMVRRPRPPRRVGDPLRLPVHPGAGVPRRRLSRCAPARPGTMLSP